MRAHSTPAWVVAAARAHATWAIGSEITEAEYRAAIELVTTLRLR